MGHASLALGLRRRRTGDRGRACYPGSFDPPYLMHDVRLRGLALWEHDDPEPGELEA